MRRIQRSCLNFDKHMAFLQFSWDWQASFELENFARVSSLRSKPGAVRAHGEERRVHFARMTVRKTKRFLNSLIIILTRKGTRSCAHYQHASPPSRRG